MLLNLLQGRGQPGPHPTPGSHWAARRSTVPMLRNSALSLSCMIWLLKERVTKWAYCPITFWSIICWWVEPKWTRWRSTSSPRPLTPAHTNRYVSRSILQISRPHCAQNLRFVTRVKGRSASLPLYLLYVFFTSLRLFTFLKTKKDKLVGNSLKPRVMSRRQLEFWSLTNVSQNSVSSPTPSVILDQILFLLLRIVSSLTWKNGANSI